MSATEEQSENLQQDLPERIKSPRGIPEELHLLWQQHSKATSLREITVFNFLEAMCWIYTCCISSDEILANREKQSATLISPFLSSRH